MKKLYLFLALCLMSVMNAHANSQELTVYPGTATSNMVPIALNYCDSWTESQHIIPASLLTEMAGGQIFGLQYYTTASSEFTSKASIELVMWEVSSSTTTLNGFLNYGQPNVSYNGNVDFIQDGGQIRATILFDTPFEYHGGSLVIDVHNPNQSWSENVVFYGQAQQSTSWAGYNPDIAYVTGSKQNFAPMTTFYYEKEELVDEREVITHIELEGFNPGVLKAGEVIEDLFVFSSLEAVDEYVPYFINLGSSNLYKYVEQYNGYERLDLPATITAGEYAVSLYLVISSDNIDSYRFPDTHEGEEAPTAIVDGQAWTVEYSFVAETYSGCYITSPNIRVWGQGIEDIVNRQSSNRKFIKDGLLLIERNGKTYNTLGVEMK